MLVLKRDCGVGAPDGTVTPRPTRSVIVRAATKYQQATLRGFIISFTASLLGISDARLSRQHSKFTREGGHDMKGKHRTAILVVPLLLQLMFSPILSGLAQAQTRADLTRLVVIGDSLSAGFLNSSLLDSQQIHGYPNVIATQARTPMTLPLIGAPGIPNVLQLVSVGPPPVVEPRWVCRGCSSASLEAKWNGPRRSIRPLSSPGSGARMLSTPSFSETPRHSLRWRSSQRITAS